MHSEFSPSWEKVETCPLCGWDETEIFDKRTEHSIALMNNICLRCGLVYQSPRMEKVSLERYYQMFYVTQHQRAQGVSEKEIEIQKRRAQFVVEILRRFNVTWTHHLDIGSSTGLLLEEVRQVFGTRSTGVELADTYRDYASERGLEIYPTLDDLPETYTKNFDLITMLHVLEHLSEPKAFLARLREHWLAEDGLLMVEVPNLFFHATFEVPHLTHYHAGTLTAMLEQSGYRVALLLKHGSPRSRRFPLNLLAIAHSGPSRLKSSTTWASPRMIRAQRKLGRMAYLLVAGVLKALRLGKPTELELLDRARR